MKLSNKHDPIVLYKDESHECLMFPGLVNGDGIQSNQFLITDHGRAAVLDPGGDLTYTALTIELSKRINLQKLDYVMASHQDPDIISSLPRWLTHTRCKVVCSKLWERFLPHLVSNFITDKMERDLTSRIMGLPDHGAELPLGESSIIAVPAHFLHSVGNFQFYDPTSKILFTGDMGASLGSDVSEEVGDFSAHIPLMESFHKRYMASRKVTKLWANMVRSLDIEMIVPQHGAVMKGKTIAQFLHWIENLDCGIDLLSQKHFKVLVAPSSSYLKHG